MSKTNYFLIFSLLKRKIFRHYSLIQKGIISLFFCLLISFIFYFVIPVISLGKEILTGPVNIFSLLTTQNNPLKNIHGKTNILLLGTGGANHDGPDLTDAMIVASIENSKPVLLFSIPRDIYLESLNEKVNSAYEIGKQNGSNSGLALAKSAVEKITGIPIHYALKIDFNAFKKIVDLVGGIDIVIDNTLDDHQYPIDGKENDLCDNDPEFKCRYETLHFDPGLTHLDGKTALKFVRSRKSDSDEGTDFARSRRQQIVLKSIKDKIFSTKILLNPTKLLAIYSELKNNIDLDFDQKEAAFVLKIASNFKTSEIKSYSIPPELLINPPIDSRGWILLPLGGNFDKIHQDISEFILQNQ